MSLREHSRIDGIALGPLSGSRPARALAFPKGCRALLIGVDATCWANERGYGRFAREIVTRLPALASKDEIVCFLDAESAARFAVRAPNIRTVRVDLSAAPVRAASAAGRRSIRDMLALTRAVAREKLDVMFFPSVYTYFPVPPRLRAVVTLHDAIPERFPALTLPTLRARLFWRLKVRLALLQSREIVTVSEFAAGDIIRELGVRRNRISIISEAAASQFKPAPQRQIEQASKRIGLPPDTPWFIYVGGFNPHKNVRALVEAHGALARELGPRTPRLVLVGDRDRDAFHGDQPAILQAISDAGTGDLVVWAGFIRDDELAKLYSGATALVLPSECEGFGLPAVEAAACGAPVIATTESPLPDILEGGGLFVQPGDSAGLHSAMRRLATDTEYGAELGRAGLERAGRLSWVNATRQTLDVIRKAAA